MLSGGQSTLIQSTPKITCHQPPQAETLALAGSCPPASPCCGLALLRELYHYDGFQLRAPPHPPLAQGLGCALEQPGGAGACERGGCGAGWALPIRDPARIWARKGWQGELGWQVGTSACTASATHLLLSPADCGRPGCQPHDEAHPAPAQV